MTPRRLLPALALLLAAPAAATAQHFGTPRLSAGGPLSNAITYGPQPGFGLGRGAGFNNGFVNNGFYPYGGFGFAPFGFGFGGYYGGGAVNINLAPGSGGYYDPDAALRASIPSLTTPYYPRRQLNTGGGSTTPPVPALPDAAVITVRVPADATVFLQGQKMKADGEVRRFVSPRLDAGREYTYAVRAVWKIDGKEVERTMEVPVSAGSTPSVTFLAPGARPAADAPRGG